MPKLIYVDNAAATPVDPAVLKAMLPYFADEFYNPSATYMAAKQVRQALDEARSLVARWLGARNSEITFTAGGTEANNLAIHGIMRQFPEGNILVSAMEHESVLIPARNYDCREVRLGPDGRIDLNDFENKLDDKTVLVSIIQASNEIGTIQPLRGLSQIIQARRSKRAGSLPLYFHTDAAQAGNYLDLHVARLGVDMMSVNGGKIYGPKQSGALYIKAGISLKPQIEGGGQERGLRSGTENVAGAVGLAKALDLAQSMRHEEAERLKQLQYKFLKSIKAELPHATVNGSLKQRLPNNVHLTLPGQDNERLLIQLEQEGILAAAGSACSASNEEPSHVLKAIGLADKEARASLRFSLGRSTTEPMVDACVQALKQLASSAS